MQLNKVRSYLLSEISKNICVCVCIYVCVYIYIYNVYVLSAVKNVRNNFVRMQ